VKYQTRPYTCGPAAVVNALRLFGLHVPEAHVAKLAGTTVTGTDDRQLMRALRKLGCGPTAVSLTSTVRKRVQAGIPVIIHLDEELHWVVIIGCLGDNLIAFDSYKGKSNIEENGVRVITPEELGGKVFGICVKKPLDMFPEAS
jgi:ABC-type bacteriocin/lantibiotic exporter with double-glycine peptidase domain